MTQTFKIFDNVANRHGQSIKGLFKPFDWIIK